jgi:hypothetical protein
MWKMSVLAGMLAISLFSFEGAYQGSGSDPYEDATYTVKAVFTKDQNGVYQATWEEVEKGVTAHYVGTGMKFKDCISFTYLNTENSSDMGIQFYKLKGDTLEGPFVMINKNLVGNEKLTRSK